MDALEVRLHALGLHPDRRGLYRMVSGGLGSREAAMDALLGSQPLYWQHREEVLARHPIRFCYPQLLTPGLPEVLHTLHCMVLCGMDDQNFVVADPLDFNRVVPRVQFMKIYRQLGRRAVVIKKDS